MKHPLHPLKMSFSIYETDCGHAFMYVCTCLCMYIHAYAYLKQCVYINKYIYIRTEIQTRMQAYPVLDFFLGGGGEGGGVLHLTER